MRTQADVDAVVAALADGTIDLIATDHAPHAQTDKLCTYQEAANGIANLETALGSVLSLNHSGAVSLPVLIERMTAAPARFLNMDIGSLKAGGAADVTIFDPDIEWRVDVSEMSTLGKNTPLAGTNLKGRVTTTIFGGTVVWDAATVISIG